MYQSERDALVAALHRLAEAHYDRCSAGDLTASGQSAAPGKGSSKMKAGGAGADSGLHGDMLALLEGWVPIQRRAPIEPVTATVLISDIRGFTGLMATNPPSVMVRLLDRYVSLMCSSVERYGGRVDKFMGDSVMAVFGVPRARNDDLQRALACAVDMQHGMARLNQVHRQAGDPELHSGIAVSTGRVMAGTFGPERHGSYTVIGDTVNLAARMESFSLRGQVLISEAVHASAAHFVEVGPANQVQPKGVIEPVTLYPLKAVHFQGRYEVPSMEPRKSPRVRVDLDALFREVQAKRVAATEFNGQVKDIGYFGLSAELPQLLPSLSELAIELPWVGRERPGYLYARVLRAAPAGPRYRTSLEFTAVDTPAHRAVKSMVDEHLWHH
jgi:adenylate cyclase